MAIRIERQPAKRVRRKRAKYNFELLEVGQSMTEDDFRKWNSFKACAYIYQKSSGRRVRTETVWDVPRPFVRVTIVKDAA